MSESKPWTDINLYFDWIDTLPPLPTLALSAVIVGYGLRRSEWFPNKSILLALIILGGIEYPLMQYGIMPMILKGSIVTGLVWVFHKVVIRRVEDRYPFLKKLLGGLENGFDSSPEAFRRCGPTADVAIGAPVIVPEKVEK